MNSKGGMNMTWTIWYDSYYYIEGERLPNVIGQYDTKEEAIEAAMIIANKDMAAFLLKHENGWVQAVEGDLDDDPDGECTFTLGIRPDPENEPRTIHSSVTVSFRVIEVDIIPTSLTTFEEEMIANLVLSRTHLDLTDNEEEDE